MLATFFVTSSSDAPEETPAAIGTLRQAIFDANNTPGHDTIEFTSAVNGATIALTEGQLDISESVEIDASMLSSGITIDADSGSRILDITDTTSGSAPPEVTMIALTLTGGDVSGHGGAIQSAGLLDIQDCVIEANQASGDGGGIYVRVSGSGSISRTVLNLENTTIKNNTADQSSGIPIIAALILAHFRSPAKFDSAARLRRSPVVERC